MADGTDSVPQPQFRGGGPTVLVKNTFIDVDDIPQPLPLTRGRTAPPSLSSLKDSSKDMALSDAETSSSIGDEQPATPTRAEFVESGDDLTSSVAEDAAWMRMPWPTSNGQPCQQASAEMPLFYPETHNVSLSGTGAFHMLAPVEHDGQSNAELWPSMGFTHPGQQMQPVQAVQPLQLVPVAHMTPQMFHTSGTDMQSMAMSALSGNGLTAQSGASESYPHIGAANSAVQCMETMDVDADDDDDAVALQPQTLKKNYNQSSGAYRVLWVVDARKLRGNDKQAVSPPFELFCAPGQRGTTFKIMIYPSYKCFREAKGQGFIQLKCEEELPEEFAQVSYQLLIGKGTKVQGPRSSTHNFAKSAVCGLPKNDDKWDFNTVVDRASTTFNVVLEITPQRPALQLGIQ